MLLPLTDILSTSWRQGCHDPPPPIGSERCSPSCFFTGFIQIYGFPDFLSPLPWFPEIIVNYSRVRDESACLWPFLAEIRQ